MMMMYRELAKRSFGPTFWNFWISWFSISRHFHFTFYFAKWVNQIFISLFTSRTSNIHSRRTLMWGCRVDGESVWGPFLLWEPPTSKTTTKYASTAFLWLVFDSTAMCVQPAFGIHQLQCNVGLGAHIPDRHIWTRYTTSPKYKIQKSRYKYKDHNCKVGLHWQTKVKGWDAKRVQHWCLKYLRKSLLVNWITRKSGSPVEKGKMEDN